MLRPAGHMVQISHANERFPQVACVEYGTCPYSCIGNAVVYKFRNHELQHVHTKALGADNIKLVRSFHGHTIFHKKGIIGIGNNRALSNPV